MLNLELASNEDLCLELHKRYTACAILGVRQEDQEQLDVLLHGPSYMVEGLLHHVLREINDGLRDMEDP